MVKILITDDDSGKIKHLREVLDRIPEIQSYDVSQDVIGAKKYLSNGHYDLLILDLNLPLRAGDDPKPENGINFLTEINRSNRLAKPFHIIGLTAFDELRSKFENHFNDDLWALIIYENSNNKWEKQITNKIEYLVQSKRSLQNPSSTGFEYDLAIITALREPELQSVLNLQGEWQEFKMPNDSTEYYKGIFQKGDLKIKVIAASAPQMGMVASSVLATKMIHFFRPKYIVMCGIAAGIKGNGNIGDILATDISFDSGSGKIKTDHDGESKFEPDYRSLILETDLKEDLLSCKSKREFLNEIKRKWNADAPETELNLHIGPLASGAGVIENNKIIDEIRGHSRKLIGIDMETYGIFYAVKHCSKPRPLAALSLKSISDFADSSKNDKYQKYASYTSASFMFNYVTEKLILSTL